MNVHNPRRQRSSKPHPPVVGRPKPNRDHHHKQQGNRKEKLPVILTSRQVLRQIWRNLLDCSQSSFNVLVQREMDSWRSPLASIPPCSADSWEDIVRRK